MSENDEKNTVTFFGIDHVEREHEKMLEFPKRYGTVGPLEAHLNIAQANQQALDRLVNDKPRMFAMVFDLIAELVDVERINKWYWAVILLIDKEYASLAIELIDWKGQTALPGVTVEQIVNFSWPNKMNLSSMIESVAVSIRDKDMFDAVQKAIYRGSMDTIYEVTDDMVSEIEHEAVNGMIYRMAHEFADMFEGFAVHRQPRMGWVTMEEYWEYIPPSVGKTELALLLDDYRETIKELFYAKDVNKGDFKVIEEMFDNCDPLVAYMQIGDVTGCTEPGEQFDELVSALSSVGLPSETGKWRRELDELIDNTTYYGGNICLFFNIQGSEILNWVRLPDNKDVKIVIRDPDVAIYDSLNGAGHHVQLADLTLKMTFDRKPFYIESPHDKYSYTFGVVGMDDDWCDCDVEVITNGN